MSEKQTEVNKVIDKMRTNTEKSGRRTANPPLRRFRVKVQKARHTDGTAKQA